jgi:hypothetical protein
MDKEYEVPELTLIGEADEVVMGLSGSGLDMPHEFGLDFEFEED